MTTLVLQAAGSAIGTAIAGPFGGQIGQLAGAYAGAQIDQALFNSGGTRKVVGPRLNEMDGLASTEGAPIPRVYGRAKLGGQLIWATRFEEEVVTNVRKARGGKGLSSGPKTREVTFSYYANLAVGLCEGPISFVRRIWADGRELDLTRTPMRVHSGDDDQPPDALIVAKEGADRAPAYRGTAYVVFERLPLADYGNRVPQFTFEIVRALPGVREQVRAVNLIPGSSEFAYETQAVSRVSGLGASKPENRLQLQAETDIAASLDQLQALCPNLDSINLVVTWFGDDLRAGQCAIAPRIDNADKRTEGAVWEVAGLDRAQARLVTMVDGRAAYGGTPSDASVLSAIAEMKRRGLKVTLYPFIMMDIGPENTLPDPGLAGQQPAFPWRGRITCHPAPLAAGSPDGTAAAATQVAAFVGTVSPADTIIGNGRVTTPSKPQEWSFRRLVMHYVRLAELAGGVDGFIIGTEMVGLTRVRSASGVYPFVTALTGIAADARAVLGPAARITYAADWTEYGAHVLSGGQEVRFPLDPLWASPHVNAVGIDYYAPITDWRDGPGHADEALGCSQHDLAYLASRQRSGEAFDWFYPSPAARALQQRSPITDGAFGKPWIYRPKDLAAWWMNPHVERVGGVESPTATAWQPGSKPVMLTEIGCPAVDKGANAPNIFPDVLSAEGGRPPFSLGHRDDLAQLRALEAQIGVFDPASALFDATANPVHPVTGLRMIAPADITVWAWDARPFPAFPMLTDIWSDGANWATGHWINGRLESAPLDRLVAAIVAEYGLPAPVLVNLDHTIDGYVIDRPMSAREALEPLAQLFGFDVLIAAGEAAFRDRDARLPLATPVDLLLPDRNGEGFRLTRAQETELPREVRISFVDGDFDYRRASARSRRLIGAARRELAIEAAAIMGRHIAERLTEARLKDAWVGRETLSFTMSPRCGAFEPSDHILFPVNGSEQLFRIARIDDGEGRVVTAVSAERAAGQVKRLDPVPRRAPAPHLTGKPFALAVELPAVGADGQVLQWIAVSATPWSGSAAVLRASGAGGLSPWAEVTRPALVGRTLGVLPPGPLWRWDRNGALDIEIDGGALQSVPDADVLAGGNTFAILGPDGLWELFSATKADLIGERRYRLSRLLRGLGGSEALAARTLAAGAVVIAVDEALAPLTGSVADIGRAAQYRVVPPGLDAGDPATVTIDTTLRGLALKPLSPVHARARRGPDGVTIRWTRRSRVDGDNWELADPPLAEGPERYRLTLLSGASPVITFEVNAPQHLLPAAQEMALFGAAQGALRIELAQISQIVGEGAVLSAEVPVF